MSIFKFVFKTSTSLSLLGNSGHHSWVRPPQEQHYPLLSACAVFSCVQTMVWTLYQLSYPHASLQPTWWPVTLALFCRQHWRAIRGWGAATVPGRHQNETEFSVLRCLCGHLCVCVCARAPACMWDVDASDVMLLNDSLNEKEMSKWKCC